MGKQYVFQIIDYIFINYSSKRYPKKKVRKFRDWIKRTPPLVVFYWLYKKFKYAKDAKNEFFAMVPLKEAEPWRIDDKQLEVYFVEFGDAPVTPTYLGILRRWIHILKRRARRASFNLFKLIRHSWKVRYLSELKYLEEQSGRLLPKHPLLDYWTSGYEAYERNLRVFQFYADLRQQWLYQYSAYKYHWFLTGSSLLHKHTGYVAWSNRLLERPFNLFTLLDRFVPIFRNRFRRFIPVRFKRWKQLYYDLAYVESAIDFWHDLREGIFPSTNQFRNVKYYTHFFYVKDILDYEMSEFELRYKVRRQRIVFKYKVLSFLLYLLTLPVFFMAVVWLCVRIFL